MQFDRQYDIANRNKYVTFIMTAYSTVFTETAVIKEYFIR